MAFAATHQVSSGTNTDNTAFTTASVSVTAGDLLWVTVSNGIAVQPAPAPTSLTGTLGSTLNLAMAGSVLMNSSLVGITSIWWAHCPVTTSGTITFNFPSTQSNCQWNVSTITGADNADPIIQVDTFQTAATNPSMTISPSPGAASMVIGAMHANIATAPTAGTGYTLLGTVPAFAGASPALGQTVQYDLTSPSATFAFTLASATNKGLIAVELRAPGDRRGLQVHRKRLQAVSRASTW